MKTVWVRERAGIDLQPVRGADLANGEEVGPRLAPRGVRIGRASPGPSWSLRRGPSKRGLVRRPTRVMRIWPTTIRVPALVALVGLSVSSGHVRGLMSSERKAELRALVKDTFYHAFDTYMR